MRNRSGDQCTASSDLYRIAGRDCGSVSNQQVRTEVMADEMGEQHIIGIEEADEIARDAMLRENVVRRA